MRAVTVQGSERVKSSSSIGLNRNMTWASNARVPDNIIQLDLEKTKVSKNIKGTAERNRLKESDKMNHK